MYINFQLAKTKGLTPTDVANLQLIYQNKLESLWEIITETVSLQTLDRYQQLGYITLVKAKNKSDSIQNRVRLSKKGNEVLEDLQVPEVNSDDLQLYDWLERTYQKEDKEIGNRKKTKLYIALFRAHSGIDRNKLAFLCKTFMNDSSQFEWSKRLEYLFFKPVNVFSVKFDLEQSKLYQYYIKHKEHFDNKFAKIDEDGN
jgi:DNA-binding PadR family transcriptional regulator